MLSTDIINRAQTKIGDTLEQIEFFQDQILLADDEKLLWDEAIVNLDGHVLEEIEVVNRTFADVQGAYRDRINVGCKTDMFWRMIEYEYSGGGGGGGSHTYTLECTKLAAGGYEQVDPYRSGIATLGVGNTVYFVDHSGTLAKYPRNTYWETPNEESDAFDDPGGSDFGFDKRNLYGLKYYDNAQAQDIGDTFVGSFIGTMTAGINSVTVMQPVGYGFSDSLAIDQIVTTERDGVFSLTAKITGITTGLVNLQEVPGLGFVGIGTTLSWVNILTLDQTAGIGVSAPNPDGRFTTFRVLDDPDNYKDEGREKYKLIPWDKDPYNPETVGIMTTSILGIGTYIKYDNSGSPQAPQDWNPWMGGFPIDFLDPDQGNIAPPNVGADQSYWSVGFSTRPINASGGRAIEGDIREVNSLSVGAIYEDLSSCPASGEGSDAAITSAIGISSTKETSFVAADGDTQTKIGAVNGLRKQRFDVTGKIWAYRQGIGHLNDEYEGYIGLENYINDTLIINVLDR